MKCTSWFHIILLWGLRTHMFLRGPGCADTCFWKVRRWPGTSAGGGALGIAFCRLIRQPALIPDTHHPILFLWPAPQRAWALRSLFAGKVWLDLIKAQHWKQWCFFLTAQESSETWELRGQSLQFRVWGLEAQGSHLRIIGNKPLSHRVALRIRWDIVCESPLRSKILSLLVVNRVIIKINIVHYGWWNLFSLPASGGVSWGKVVVKQECSGTRRPGSDPCFGTYLLFMALVKFKWVDT